MSDKRRVKNAVKVSADGYTFKSKLEYIIYTTIKEAGFNVEYESMRFCIQEGFDAVVNLKRERIRPCYYRPDFVIRRGDVIFIIEAKGYPTDTWKLRRKLILKKLESEPNIVYFEVKSTAQMKEILNEIKHLEVATTNSAR